MKMNFQAMKIVQGKKISYIIRMKKKDFDKFKEICKNEKSNNTTLYIKNAKWIEVELDLENESYFGIGFLSFEPEEEMIISFPKKIEKLNDEDIIPVTVTSL
jgi:hypothetical protein